MLLGDRDAEPAELRELRPRARIPTGVGVGELGNALGREALGEEALVVNGPGDWAYQQLRSRGNTIEAGTSEILRSIIAERVLGLPRSR